MNQIARKISALLPDLESRGPVYLFALGEREDVNRWDVMLSASWSDRDYSSAVGLVAGELQTRLEPSEIVTLARVVIIPSDSSTILEMPWSLEWATPGEPKLVNLPIDEWDVRRMYVIKALRPSPQFVGSGVEAAAFPVGV